MSLTDQGIVKISPEGWKNVPPDQRSVRDIPGFPKFTCQICQICWINHTKEN